MDYKDIIRKDIYDSLSDDAKHMLMHRETMERLDEVERKSRHSFLSDLSANVAGNALWDGTIWLLSKFLK